MFAGYEMETDLRSRGSSVVVGIDEVGRGALAGPLVSAAVVLPAGCNLNLRDSKKLSKKRRADLFTQIIDYADDFGIGLVNQHEIDSLGLSAALQLSYLRALEMMDRPFNVVILDGSYDAIGEDFVICRVSADAEVACVAAASIVAKVYRDELMGGLSTFYPDYGFERHVGYGTRRHLEAIKVYGPSQIHRQSFRVKL